MKSVRHGCAWPGQLAPGLHRLITKWDQSITSGRVLLGYTRLYNLVESSRWQTNDKVDQLYWMTENWPIFVWHTTDAMNLAEELGSNFAEKIGRFYRSSVIGFRFIVKAYRTMADMICGPLFNFKAAFIHCGRQVSCHFLSARWIVSYWGLLTFKAYQCCIVQDYHTYQVWNFLGVC